MGKYSNKQRTSGCNAGKPLSGKDVHPGDVFMMKDRAYTKQRNDVPNTEEIRFDRPVVVIAVCSEVATCVPLTTKNNKYNVSYPLHIEEEKVSYALVSQVKSIGISNLLYRIGIIKPDILIEMRNALIEFLKGGEKTKITRIINGVYNNLDIRRFHPYHIYKSPDTSEMFMILPSINHSSFVVRVKDTKSCSSIETICGYVDMSAAVTLTDDFYEKDFEDLGIEFRKDVRKAIERNFKKIYKVQLSTYRQNDYMTTFSSIIYKSYMCTNHTYLEGVKIAKEIMNSTSLQKMFLSDPQSLERFIRGCSGGYIFYESKLINTLLPEIIVRGMNLITCDIGCLEYAKENYENILCERIENHKILMDISNPGKLKDSELLDKHRYSIQNIQWIANFIKTHNI